MAMGVVGRWQVDINGDDIQTDEFRLLTIEEKADLSLPIAHLQFVTQDFDKVKRYTSPGYKIEIGLGAESPSDATGKFQVFKKRLATFQGNDTWAVDCFLILDFLDYVNKHRTETYTTTDGKKKSSEVFNTVWGRVGLSPDVESSQDKMMWLQPNTTDRRFLEDVAQHGWFGQGKPAAFGIRRDKKAIYKPADSLLTPKKTIGTMDGSDLMVEEYAIETSDGFLSSWVGKERWSPTQLHEEGLNHQETKTPEDYKTDTDSLISDKVGLYDNEKFAPWAWQNDNVHDNWVKSEAQNLQYRASMASQTMEISEHEQYHDLYVLDCLEGMWARIDGKKPALLPQINGPWLISKMLTFISIGHFRMDFSLSRETMVS
jgi:hypothetical protein